MEVYIVILQDRYSDDYRSIEGVFDDEQKAHDFVASRDYHPEWHNIYKERLK